MLNSALRPSTQAAYSSMFKVFLAFCIYMKLTVVDVHVGVLLAFLECLHVNNVSVSMICNYLSAISAKLIMYALSTTWLDDRKLQINWPLCITKCNSITIEDLYAMDACCDSLYMWEVCFCILWIFFIIKSVSSLFQCL